MGKSGAFHRVRIGQKETFYRTQWPAVINKQISGFSKALKGPLLGIGKYVRENVSVLFIFKYGCGVNGRLRLYKCLEQFQLFIYIINIDFLIHSSIREDDSRYLLTLNRLRLKVNQEHA